MMVEARHYTLHPGALPQYLRLFQSEQGVLDCLRPHLRAFWFTESNMLNSVHHLWEYENRAARAKARAEMAANPAMSAFFAKAVPLLQTQRSQMFLGDVAKPEASKGGVYDRLQLRFSPGLPAGEGEELLAHWRQQLSAHFKIVACLQGRLLESAGALREALVVLRSESLEARDRHASALGSLPGMGENSDVFSDVSLQLMLPAPFSAWQ